METTFICDLCPMRHAAQKNPYTLKASLWRLHTRVCPMWNSYQAATGAERPQAPEGASDDRTLLMIGGGMLAALWLVWPRRKKT